MIFTIVTTIRVIRSPAFDKEREGALVVVRSSKGNGGGSYRHIFGFAERQRFSFALGMGRGSMSYGWANGWAIVRAVEEQADDTDNLRTSERVG